MSEATVRRLEHEIERTRERMSHDLDELGQRLSPDHLRQRARETAGAQLQRLGERIAQLVRAYPEQAIAIGLGLLVALATPRRHSRSVTR